MKQIHFLTTALCVLIITSASAQYQAPDCGAIEAVIIERYYISDLNDATDTDGGQLETGSVTYRVFIDMKPNYVLESVFGNAIHPLSIESTEVFFNNEDRGEILGDALAANRLGDNTVALDSYLTFGAASTAHLGVMKAEDTDGSIVGGENNDGGSQGIGGGLLVNQSPEIGQPLTESDGLVNGTIISAATGLAGSVGTIGISDLSVFEDENTGNFFSTNNGAWFVLGGVKGPTEANRVLIAQLTTTGALDLKLNMRVGIPVELRCTAPACHSTLDYFFFLTEAEQQPSIANDRLCLLPEVIYTNELVNTQNRIRPSTFFELYPNPASDRVVMAVDPNISGEVLYQLIDLTGRPVKQGRLQQGNGIEVLELHGLANGVYILHAQYRGQSSSQKLVKR